MAESTPKASERSHSTIFSESNDDTELARLRKQNEKMAAALAKKTDEIQLLRQLEKESEGINDKYMVALVDNLRADNSVLTE